MKILLRIFIVNSLLQLAVTKTTEDSFNFTKMPEPSRKRKKLMGDPNPFSVLTHTTFFQNVVVLTQTLRCSFNQLPVVLIRATKLKPINLRKNISIPVNISCS